MWVFPALAAVVAAVFTALLIRRSVSRPRSHLTLWAIALAMYAAASALVAIGASSGWSPGTFRAYWALGAVLNVPFLAQGQLDLLVKVPWIRSALYVVLAFVAAYTVARVRTAGVDVDALAEPLPSGKDVFGDGTPAHRLPQVVAIPAYVVLIGAVAWSLWTMRGQRAFRDRFRGVLLIAIGATVIAAFGSAFAALGLLAPFSVSLLAGVSLMFVGFLTATRRREPAHAEAT